MNDLVELDQHPVQNMRITKRQYAYATVRGRMPANCADWKCKLLADGWTDEEIEGASKSEISYAITATWRWNKIPAVQAQIEHERSVAIEARLQEPIRTWEARMEKLLAMAAGELPQVRSVDTGKRKKKIVDEDVEIEARVLDTEEYHESNLQALAKVLEMQGRSLGLFKDRAEISGPGGAPLPAIQVTFVRAGDD
jgi:hypothetical protein